MGIFTWDMASCVQMVRKEKKCIEYLKVLQGVLVSSLILLTVFLVVTTRTLLTFADPFAESNTATIGSGRILHSKGKEDSLIVSTERPLSG
jgi:hypothetical protein